MRIKIDDDFVLKSPDKLWSIKLIFHEDVQRDQEIKNTLFKASYLYLEKHDPTQNNFATRFSVGDADGNYNYFIINTNSKGIETIFNLINTPKTEVEKPKFEESEELQELLNTRKKGR